MKIQHLVNVSAPRRSALSFWFSICIICSTTLYPVMTVSADEGATENQQETFNQSDETSENPATSSAGSANNNGELNRPTLDRRAQNAENSEFGRDDQWLEEPAIALDIVPITEIPRADIADREVINYKGEDIGEVDYIVTDPTGAMLGLVVGVGGFWDIGDTQIFAPIDELQASGKYVVWETFLDEETLADMAEYQLDEYSAAVP